MTCPVIFICYSEHDIECKEEIRSQLNLLAKKGLLKIWSDTDIRVGEKWKDEIFRAIDGSDIAILLVSHHFLDSDFIMKEELPRLLKRHDKKELTLFPILLSPCFWEEDDDLRQLQMRPSKKRAVSDSHDPKRTYFELAVEVGTIVKRKSEAIKPIESKQLNPVRMREENQPSNPHFRRSAQFRLRVLVLVVTIFVFWIVVVGSRTRKTIPLKLEALTVDVLSPRHLSPNEDEVLDFNIEGNKNSVSGTVGLLNRGSGTVPCISLDGPNILNGEIPKHLTKKSLRVRCQWEMGQGTAYLGEVARLSVEAQSNGQSEAKDLHLAVALIPCIKRIQTFLGVLMIIFCCFGISIGGRKILKGQRFAERS